MREAFSRAAGRAGLSVDCAGSGHEALERFARAPYPVVATDLNLPDLDGVVLIRLIQRTHPDTAFVVVTETPELLESLGEASLDRGITSLVPTPWEDEDLTGALERAFRVVEGRRAGRALELKPLLVVEDNPGDARLLELTLSETSFRASPVHRAHRLAEAVGLLRAHAYEAILADLSLPDARGLDAVGQLVVAAPDTPLIILTGMEDMTFSTQAVELGAQDYLSKRRLNATDLDRAIRHAAERKRAERKLSHRARHDTLTGLTNRGTFHERVERAVMGSRRHDRRFALLYLDLDGFKDVNDRLGHEAGDTVLVELSRRLEQAIRDSDTAARLGGDEFAVLLAGVEDRRVADLVAGRILAAVDRPFDVSGHTVRVGASVGVALFPSAADDIEELFRQADGAMYDAKRSGDGFVVVGGASGPAPGADYVSLAPDIRHSA